jgi:1,4-alpha-glucan branching enzyme
MYTHPGKKLLFMGNEIAQWREWNHDEGLPWGSADQPPHVGTQQLVRDLNSLYRREPGLYQLDYDPAGFEWIDCTDNENSVVSFVRRGRNVEQDTVIVVLNFTPVVRESYRLGVPDAGRYREIINTDAAIYGGGNVGNGGLLESVTEPSHGRPQSIVLTLPPLAALILKRDTE